jgi:chlorobactene glucosyltransferase
MQAPWRPSAAWPAQGRLAQHLLGAARTGVWLLVLNCIQNLLFAPRATAPVLRWPHTAGDRPRVSVLVPARDEAANIAACVRGLLAQGDTVTEVIVCDDGSTDETAAIVRALAALPGNARLRLLAGAPCPPGWRGKNWACQQLASAAVGEWLLFTDADTRHEPGSVAAGLALAQRHGAGLVSLLPRHHTGTLGERLLVTQVPLIAFAFLPVALVPRSWRWARPFAGANGLYLLFRRDWYAALGGYAAVRATIAEDMRFAVETKWRGGRIVLADGRAVLGCRMYRGFADAWAGCSRNAFSAVLSSLPIFLIFTAAWTCFFVLPPVALLWYGGTWAIRARGDNHPVALAAQATLGQVALRWLVGRRERRPAWEALAQPVSSLLFLGVLLNSYRLHRRGVISWRGRRFAASAP